MRARLQLFLTYINSTYWFIPGLLTLGGVLLAVLTTYLDRTISGDILRTVGRLFAGGPEDARQLFNTVAGAMITVAGVTFSLAILVLTLASQQFGPRLLYSFMRDTGTQIVLGTFVATFTYCLLVLRTVHASETSTFVPQVSATTAIVLALASQGVLIYFIHHVASSIRVNNVIVNVGRELGHTIDWYCAVQEAVKGEPPSERDLSAECSAICDHAEPGLVHFQEHGYIEIIDYESLIEVAEKHDLLIQLHYRIGQFVLDGDCLASVWPADATTDHIADTIRNGFVFGAERTAIQDIEFSMNQLVEIAVRALSAAINDPSTAVLCIDELTVALLRLARQELPSQYRTSDNGKLRLITPPLTMCHFIRIAFDPIRQDGSESIPVMRRLLQVIRPLSQRISDAEAHKELRRQAEILKATYTATMMPEEDRRELEKYYEQAIDAITRASPGRRPTSGTLR